MSDALLSSSVRTGEAVDDAVDEGEVRVERHGITDAGEKRAQRGSDSSMTI